MKLHHLLAPLALFALTAASHATVLTFDGLTSQNADYLNTHNAGYGGFTWGDTWALFNSASFGVPVHSGSYGIVNDYGTVAESVTMSSASTFDFTGVWIGGWPFSAPSSITIEGLDETNTLIAGDSLTVNLSDSSPLQFAAAGWSGVRAVRFSGGGFYTLDDFTFNANASQVPEPGSLALVGLALAGASFAVRRRRRA